MQSFKTLKFVSSLLSALSISLAFAATSHATTFEKSYLSDKVYNHFKVEKPEGWQVYKKLLKQTQNDKGEYRDELIAVPTSLKVEFIDFYNALNLTDAEQKRLKAFLANDKKTLEDISALFEQMRALLEKPGSNCSATNKSFYNFLTNDYEASEEGKLAVKKFSEDFVKLVEKISPVFRSSIRQERPYILNALAMNHEQLLLTILCHRAGGKANGWGTFVLDNFDMFIQAYYNTADAFDLMLSDSGKLKFVKKKKGAPASPAAQPSAHEIDVDFDPNL